MKTYTVKKYNAKSDRWLDLGCGYTEDDVNAITKEYKFNGLFYERKGTTNMLEVTED